MATPNSEIQCATLRCIGCLQEFCFNHFVEHRQQLSKQLDTIKQDCDLFQQGRNPQADSLIQQIDQWERESIEKIKQTAQEIRQSVLVHIHENITSIKDKVNQLAEQMKYSREQNSMNENCFNGWKEELEQMSKPSNIFIQQTQTSLINQIQVQFSGLPSIRGISDKARWTQNGIIVAGGNGPGNAVNQLHGPQSLCINDDETIYIVDQCNNRIVQWKKGARIGEVIAGGSGVGHRNGQFNNPRKMILDKQNDFLIVCDTSNRRVVWWPRRKKSCGETIISDIICSGLAMDHDGYLYVSDFTKHEVRRWEIGDKDGILVAGGNGSGNRLDQLNLPMHIFVDQDQSVYVSDYHNHRVMKWMKGAREGIVVAGGQGEGNSLKQLYGPSGIVVDQFGTIYVADYYNNRVVRWLKGATEGSIVVAGDGQANALSQPSDITFDPQNNLYVVEWNNHRVQKFNVESD